MITVDGIKIIPTLFPDKTSQVWKIDESLIKKQIVKTEWHFESEAEVMHLAQLKDLLDAYGVRQVLYISYLPYARQDKYVSNETTFARKSFLKLLETMDFDFISVCDPHSPLDQESSFFSLYPEHQIEKAKRETQSSVVVYPDNGAKNKYRNILKYDYICAEKIRNQSTGVIESLILSGSVTGKNVLIIDDICDGGATFVYLAQALAEQGAKEINLFVSHGLFTKGIKVLTDAGINRIYTKDGEVNYDTSN